MTEGPIFIAPKILRDPWGMTDNQELSDEQAASFETPVRACRRSNRDVMPITILRSPIFGLPTHASNPSSSETVFDRWAGAFENIHERIQRESEIMAQNAHSWKQPGIQTIFKTRLHHNLFSQGQLNRIIDPDDFSEFVKQYGPGRGGTPLEFRWALVRAEVRVSAKAVVAPTPSLGLIPTETYGVEVLNVQ